MTRVVKGDEGRGDAELDYRTGRVGAQPKLHYTGPDSEVDTYTLHFCSGRHTTVDVRATKRKQNISLKRVSVSTDPC